MPSKKIDFEASINELAQIVERLESGECTLDESIALFEKGVTLSNACSKLLETARQKIVSLTECEGVQNSDD